MEIDVRDCLQNMKEVCILVTPEDIEGAKLTMDLRLAPSTNEEKLIVTLIEMGKLK